MRLHRLDAIHVVHDQLADGGEVLRLIGVGQDFHVVGIKGAVQHRIHAGKQREDAHERARRNRQRQHGKGQAAAFLDDVAHALADGDWQRQFADEARQQTTTITGVDAEVGHRVQDFDTRAVDDRHQRRQYWHP